MNEASREQRINEAFVRVADTLMDSYDVVDLLSSLVTECVDLLDVQAGGLLIDGGDGNLELIASTSEEAEFVEIMQVAAGAGPCVDCFTTGLPISVSDLELSGDRWPEFRRAAADRGFRSVHATPMRLRGRVIGAMNLLSTSVGTLDERDERLAQALADVAILGILQERSQRDPRFVAEQLHLALDSRVMVEQAKGVLAHTQNVSMDEAFNLLRAFARSSTQSLRVVAEGVVDRSISADDVAAPASTRVSGDGVSGP
ncbi:response regulator receiver and ANTAR domain protein [Glaciihabitans tibetensis]|uniref:Response regulator receiver and ANTAR domain protein n=1 Tax=Glaciihabitans tibetensis TaxID=1266600 RepID=A0A2T0V2B7_9MICO|nr:GAF and ANTAR domain-containing protein [Glaciihabitans tibetensis]PRY64304.1 response regulator receiver and ANTAR domain protein [Glaciihabitans tibetensis]